MKKTNIFKHSILSENKEIEKVLLKAADQKDHPDIILIYIDTTYDDNSNIAPYFNVFAAKISDNENFNSALKLATENQDEGFMWDILHETYSSTFETNLSDFYPQWPRDDENNDQKLVSIIKELVAKKKLTFEHINKMYFFHLDSFNFIKIIDKNEII